MGVMLKSKNSSGETLLILAAQRGDQKLVTYLLSLGTNIEAKDVYGSTPLLGATQKRHYEVVSLLLQHEANPNCANYLKVRTPLFYAESSSRYCLPSCHQME